jgi:Uma2 family endonuclease
MTVPAVLNTPQPDLPQSAAHLEALSATGVRYELVKGRLREMSPTSSEHARATKRLDQALTSFIYSNELGECFTAEGGFTIARDPDTVLAPDWAFVRSQRLPTPLPERDYLNLAPDLVLETRSPGDTARWVEEKTALWLAAGTCAVLNLDPLRRRLTVHRLNREPELYRLDDTLELEELPGLRVPLRATLRW